MTNLTSAFWKFLNMIFHNVSLIFLKVGYYKQAGLRLTQDNFVNPHCLLFLQAIIHWIKENEKYTKIRSSKNNFIAKDELVSYIFMMR